MNNLYHSYDWTGQMGQKIKMYSIPTSHKSEKRRLTPAYKFNAENTTENTLRLHKLDIDFYFKEKLVDFQGELLKCL